MEKLFKHKRAILTILTRLVIELIIDTNNIFQKDIAKSIGESQSTVSNVKKEDSNLTKLRVYNILIKMIISYKVEYEPLVEIALNKFIEEKRRKKEEKLIEKKRREESKFNLRGIAYISEKKELLFLDFIFEPHNASIFISLENKEPYFGSFRPRMGKRIIELRAGDQSTIQLSLDQLITKKAFEEKNILTGVISIMEEARTLFSTIILLNPTLINEFPSMYDDIPTYFQIPEIQLLFRKEKRKKLGNIIKLIENFKNYNRNVFIKIPQELTTSYKQFLDFFADYVRIAKGFEIQFDTLKRHESMEIHVKTNESIPIIKVGEYLNEYLGFIKQNIEKLEIPIETDLNKNQFNSLVLDLKHQIRSFEHSIELTKHRLEVANEKIDDLSQEVDYFKQLTIEFAKKDNIIHTQIIQGGEQQFADKIKNK